jgi:hypothetical protein
MLESSGLHKITGTSDTALTLPDGVTTIGALKTLFDVAQANLLPLVPMGYVRTGKRHALAEMIAASTQAANATITVKIRSVKGPNDFALFDESESVLVRLLGELVFTVGTATGVAGNALYDDTYRQADTCVWTPSAYGTAIETALGSAAAAASPADNTLASFILPDAFNAAALLLEIVNSASGQTSVLLVDTGV